LMLLPSIKYIDTKVYTDSKRINNHTLHEQIHHDNIF
jgi:hypothetical protein